MSGLVYAALAYVLWGLFPIYFHALARVDAFEIVMHRSLWSFVFVWAVLLAMRRLQWVRGVVRQPRMLAQFALSALLLSGNWTLYVWAVNHGNVVEASLGYFVTPLVNVLLGTWVLHERPRRLQWLAVAVAACGVLWLTATLGRPPWIALGLAITFGFYGLLRKTAPLGALEGLAVETGVIAPLALAFLAWMSAPHGGLQGMFAGKDAATVGWLLFAGPLTAIPLLLFASGARRIPLSVLGLLQYLSPTLQFLLGVSLFHEAFSADRLVGFALIWAALALYAGEGLLRNRGQSTISKKD